MHFWFHPDWEASWSSNVPPRADSVPARSSADRGTGVRLALALLQDPAVQDGDIHVTVQNGVAILEGEVATAPAKDAAVARAWVTEGVRDVCDVLTVRRRRRLWR